MRRYDADIARTYLNKLYLPGRAPRESNDLRTQTAESERIVCSFEDRKLLRWG